jgi:inhibitor of KinA
VQVPRIYAIHDRALTIEFSTSISEQINLLVLRLHASLEEKSFDGFIESVPSYSSLTVYFNEYVSVTNVEAILLQRYTQCVESFSSTNSDYTIQSIKHIIPVCYDSSYGLDIVAVAEEKNLSIDEIIKLHTTQLFRVYMIGFVPGFAYMGTLPAILETKRKNVPRLEVPKGSVAIAGLQTGIYPATIPGGWNILGRTPINLFDKTKEPCSFLRAGDLVQFQPITKEEFENHQ